jgi:DNA-binding XRE family transcriptional regulator
MIHNRLNVLRAERGISRKDLADAVGVNFQTIGYIERGDYSPSLELALKIAGFFNVPVEMVFSLNPIESLTSQVLKAKGGSNG